MSSRCIEMRMVLRSSWVIRCSKLFMLQKERRWRGQASEKRIENGLMEFCLVRQQFSFLKAFNAGLGMCVQCTATSMF